MSKSSCHNPHAGVRFWHAREAEREAVVVRW